MPATQEQPLILTLRLDDASMAFFNKQRQQYFPPERNYLNAHLTLFHQLPNQPQTFDYLTGLAQPAFQLDVSGLINMGGGVAYRLQSEALMALRKRLSAYFDDSLIPQDRQGFRPHITVQNKVTADNARKLLTELTANFQPFKADAIGLDLWTYLNGPWRHEAFYAFS